MDQPDPTSVVDDTEHHRFLFTEDGVDAELVYRREQGRLILVHTGVPESFRGRGIGGALVQAAVDAAAASGETVLATCSYARKWLEDHPDVAGKVTVEGG